MPVSRFAFPSYLGALCASPLSRLASWYMKRRTPDLVIQENYMERWHLIRTRYLCVYLHVYSGGDNKRMLHDHPWWNWSYILSGWYGEEDLERNITYLSQGCTQRRNAETAHRIASCSPGTISLFITGPRSRVWGFFCSDGWKPYYELSELKDGKSMYKAEDCA